MTFYFYITFDHHSFNCNVFGLESLTNLVFFFNFIPWHFVFISNLILILLIFIFIFSYYFLNWDCFSILSLLFYFIFLCQIWFLFFSNLYFFLSYPFFFKFFFKFIPNYFGWLVILHCYFFGFIFYAMIKSHDPYHKF
jgi:hypothetical protein